MTLIVDVDYAEDLATRSTEIYVFATRMREAANTRGAQFFLNCRYVTRPKLYPRPAKSMRIIDCLALYVFGCQVREFTLKALWSGNETSKTGYEKPKFSSFVSHPSTSRNNCVNFSRYVGRTNIWTRGPRAVNTGPCVWLGVADSGCCTSAETPAAKAGGGAMLEISNQATRPMKVFCATITLSSL